MKRTRAIAVDPENPTQRITPLAANLYPLSHAFTPRGGIAAQPDNPLACDPNSKAVLPAKARGDSAGAGVRHAGRHANPLKGTGAHSAPSRPYKARRFCAPFSWAASNNGVCVGWANGSKASDPFGREAKDPARGGLSLSP